jgi:hypothetical protein
MYTTQHYNYSPQNNVGGYAPGPIYHESRSSAQPYPYYVNNQPPTSVTYVGDRSNIVHASSSTMYTPAPPINQYPVHNHYMQGNGMSPMAMSGAHGMGNGNGNAMPSQGSFYNSNRAHEQMNVPRTNASVTAQAKTAGGFNKTLNLSDENPFHTVYGGYHYPSQIDPSKRITTQNTANRSTENKSLNLSDESPFFSTYGHYHYPSQIDPQKRITEMPKAAAPLMPTNETSNENPLQHYQAASVQTYANSGYTSYPYSTPADNWNRNGPAPGSYRPMPVQSDYYAGPPPNASQFQQAPTPPAPPPAPAPVQAPKPAASAPLDKTSLNMSPDNPFASTYGAYHYPSNDEIKSQKRMNERNQRPPEAHARPAAPVSNQMTEYPETEKKEIISGKGKTSFSRFDVNF